MLSLIPFDIYFFYIRTKRYRTHKRGKHSTKQVTFANTYLLELADPEKEPDPRFAADFPLYGTENPDSLVKF